MKSIYRQVFLLLNYWVMVIIIIPQILIIALIFLSFQGSVYFFFNRNKTQIKCFNVCIEYIDLLCDVLHHIKALIENWLKCELMRQYSFRQFFLNDILVNVLHTVRRGYKIYFVHTRKRYVYVKWTNALFG